MVNGYSLSQTLRSVKIRGQKNLFMSRHPGPFEKDGGAKRGISGSPRAPEVFRLGWHRTEDGALRAVYSDLTVTEIDESELP